MAMSFQFRVLVGLAAVIVPSLHTLTDILEWSAGGFTDYQLWINYAVFVVVPFLMLGLFAAQRPGIGSLGLVGALLYGGSFVYFSHTTLYALAEGVPDYAALWQRLGVMYTAHGIVMIVGGLAFGVAAIQAGVMPVWASGVFLLGVVINAVMGLVGAPELLQTFGSALRNLGMVAMGVFLLRGRRPAA